MSKRDWEEVAILLDTKDPNYLGEFINSNKTFLPNDSMPNPFNPNEQHFLAKQLKKKKPGDWIPIYTPQALSPFFFKKNISPIRSGKAAFFFYKGTIFFNLHEIEYTRITSSQYCAIGSFFPLTLKLNFQRNENAYLNKAVALGIINHFVEGDNYNIFKRELGGKSNNRLLYGQFGKIKLTSSILFSTLRENKNISPGFQFEIDLVLENETDIIIFEAKTGAKPQAYFSLLQLYYPLIYLRKLTAASHKKIRTIFIDIIHSKYTEEYRLIEFLFCNDNFDDLTFKKSYCYKIPVGEIISKNQ